MLKPGIQFIQKYERGAKYIPLDENLNYIRLIFYMRIFCHSNLVILGN